LKAFVLVELISIYARNTISREVSGTLLTKSKTVITRFGILRRDEGFTWAIYKAG
jgi:hypothetical protein